jgi:DNA repair protein RadD
MLTTLRPHQQEAIDAVRDAYREGHRRIVLAAPTGAGKTLMATAVLHSALTKGASKVIFTVPAISLVDQTVMALRREGIDDVGVMQASHELTNGEAAVQVCSVQTLMRRKVPKATVVIIDECHVWFQFYGKWMLDPEWKDVPFIGLSATPWTKGLGAWYTKLIIGTTTADLINEGVLSDFKVFAPYSPDLSKVRTVAGDYHEGDLAQVMNTSALVADVVETWKLRAEGRPTLVFAVDCAHARALQQSFIAAGIAADYQDASTRDSERAAIRARFHSGAVKVVCNVGTLTTGVDWDVRCIVFARPTRSEMLFVQIIGRGLRTAEGKDHCLILDHSDNHLRLGFVTDIGYDALHSGREPVAKEKEIALPKPCKGCGALLPPRTPVCPHCGFQHEPKSGKLVFADGELVELERGRREQKERAKVIDVIAAYGKQSVFSQFLHVARSRGYRDGWAANKYREVFGVWPRNLAETTSEPTPTVKSWIKSQQIAWANSASNPNRDRPRHAGGVGYE